MFRRTGITLLLFLPIGGCGSQSEETALNVTGSSAVTSSGADVDSSQDESTITKPVTREELQNELARYPADSVWHFVERTSGELTGTWISPDGKDQLVFGEDGAFGETFDGKMTSGLYAISDKGKIVTYSRSGAINLGSHFQLDGERIIGPRGAYPSATWVRQRN